MNREDDDTLLAALGARTREEQAAWEAELAALDVDPRLLERLAAGELAPAEDAALRRRAAESPAVARLYEAFRPLDHDLIGRLQARAVADLTGAAAADGALRAATATVSTLPVRRRRPLLPMALAAGLLAVLVLPVLMQRPQSDALPGYTISVAGVTAATRSADDAAAATTAPLRVDAGNLLRIVLTPQAGAPGDVGAGAWLLSSSGRLERLPDALLSVSGEGAVLVEGEVGGALLPLPAEPTRLLVVVGRRGRLPAPSTLRGALGTGASTADGEGWQGFAIDLVPGD